MYFGKKDLLTPVTPYDPILTFDTAKWKESFKLMYMYEFYVQAIQVIAFLVKMPFWPLWPQMTPYVFLDH